MLPREGQNLQGPGTSPRVQCRPHLQRGTGGVVHIGQDLHGLLEHNTEGAGRPVAAETRVVLAKDCVAVCVDDLGTESAQLPGSELSNQGLQGLRRAWPGHPGGVVSRDYVWWGAGACQEDLMDLWDQGASGLWLPVGVGVRGCSVQGIARDEAVGVAGRQEGAGE